MKFEIEVTEKEIQDAIERKVRTAIADQTNQWGTDAYIKERVKAHWQGAVQKLVAEVLNDSPALKAKIAGEVERKLRAQIASAMKVATHEA